VYKRGLELNPNDSMLISGLVVALAAFDPESAEKYLVWPICFVVVPCNYGRNHWEKGFVLPMRIGIDGVVKDHRAFHSGGGKTLFLKRFYQENFCLEKICPNLNFSGKNIVPSSWEQKFF
jgi:hypothetical protein